MDRKEFGKLLSELRKSKRDEHFHQLTQRKLAEKSGVSENILGKLERGEKISLEPDLLLALVKSLGLSPRERREFFLSAIGITESEFQASQPEASLVFADMFNNLAQIALPAFIVDSYDDIVAANNIILGLFEFSENLIAIAPTIPGGYNVLRFVFSNRSQFNSLLGKQSDQYLMQSIRFFRAISLPNRAHPYYQYLLNSFQADREMVLFNQYFQRDMMANQPDDYYFEGERLRLNHETLGELDFYSPALAPVATNKGSLYLVIYIPASPTATQACALLASRAKPGARRLAPWPEKKIP